MEYKLGPKEREKVNKLMEEAQDDLESVLFKLVWERTELLEKCKRLLHEALVFDWTSDSAFHGAVEKAEELLQQIEPSYSKIYETHAEIINRKRSEKTKI